MRPFLLLHVSLWESSHGSGKNAHELGRSNLDYVTSSDLPSGTYRAVQEHGEVRSNLPGLKDFMLVVTEGERGQLASFTATVQYPGVHTREQVIDGPKEAALVWYTRTMISRMRQIGSLKLDDTPRCFHVEPKDSTFNFLCELYIQISLKPGSFLTSNLIFCRSGSRLYVGIHANRAEKWKWVSTRYGVELTGSMPADDSTNSHLSPLEAVRNPSLEWTSDRQKGRDIDHAHTVEHATRKRHSTFLAEGSSLKFRRTDGKTLGGSGGHDQMRTSFDTQNFEIGIGQVATDFAEGAKSASAEERVGGKDDGSLISGLDDLLFDSGQHIRDGGQQDVEWIRELFDKPGSSHSPQASGVSREQSPGESRGKDPSKSSSNSPNFDIGYGQLPTDSDEDIESASGEGRRGSTSSLEDTSLDLIRFINGEAAEDDGRFEELLDQPDSF